MLWRNIYRCKLTNRRNGLFGERGLTLIEILVVVAIIGILVAMALPSFDRPLANYKLTTTAWDMASQIRLVRMRSINGEAGQVHFLIHPTARSYQVWQNAMKRETETTLPPGIDFAFPEAPVQSIIFSSMGAPSGGPPSGLYPVFRIKNSYGDTLEILVLVGTGRVRINKVQ